jgi:hypothetical protein
MMAWPSHNSRQRPTQHQYFDDVSDVDDLLAERVEERDHRRSSGWQRASTSYRIDCRKVLITI